MNDQTQPQRTPRESVLALVRVSNLPPSAVVQVLTLHSTDPATAAQTIVRLQTALGVKGQPQQSR